MNSIWDPSLIFSRPFLGQVIKLSHLMREPIECYCRIWWYQRILPLWKKSGGISHLSMSLSRTLILILISNKNLRNFFMSPIYFLPSTPWNCRRPFFNMSKDSKNGLKKLFYFSVHFGAMFFHCRQLWQQNYKTVFTKWNHQSNRNLQQVLHKQCYLRRLNHRYWSGKQVILY